LEEAVDCGLRSLFIGFETLSAVNLRAQGKGHNLNRDYAATVRRLHDLGVMVNASFVFGMDDDDPGVFARTVEWAVNQGIETATFHILTPYPGTALHARLSAEGRITSQDWDRYNTRHVVFRPSGMTAEVLEHGYWQAYHDFYAWGSILQSACVKPDLAARLRHLAFTGAWKKSEPLWSLIIMAGWLGWVTPLLEGMLGGRGSCRAEIMSPAADLAYVEGQVRKVLHARAGS